MTEITPGAQDGVHTPDELHAATLADPATPAIQAEVLEETGPRPAKTVPVKLSDGATIQVPLQREWRVSAMDAMRSGDWATWAELVLSPEDLGRWDEWYDGDPEPTLGDVTDFFERVGKATGQAAVGNRASRRSSQRTRTR